MNPLAPKQEHRHAWIPKEIYGTTLDELQEKLGFQLTGGVTEETIQVVMPSGWHWLHEDFSVDWSYILDDQDRKRAVSTTYLNFAANLEFQVLHWLRRYGVDVIDDGGTEDAPSEVRWRVVNSDSRCIHEGGKIKVTSVDGLEEHMDAIDAGAAWLFENKPNWQDYFAYWDE